MSLEIIFRDARLLVVKKPSGLLCVPGRGADKQDSLLSRLLAAGEEALLVHRLDRDTSGLVLFARDEKAQQQFARQFQERTVNKAYVALVVGTTPCDAGRLTWPLARDLSRPPRYRVDYRRGLTAVTDYRVLHRDVVSTRLELTPQTGRSHQLRVHLRELGHPILGDPLYAPPAVAAMASRLCLHAAALRMTHPDGGRLGFESPAPF
jgi:tRNA pseudouridine32 synthase/23S rRNA pseudouridine746 synthase